MFSNQTVNNHNGAGDFKMDLDPGASRDVPKGGLLYGEYLNVSFLQTYVLPYQQVTASF